jgi:hypothetical protein
MSRRHLLVVAATCAFAMHAAVSRAEPYLAIQQGYKCVMCHVNPAGGGMRNEFGNIFAQNVMPARRMDIGGGADADGWTGAVSRFVGIGGNLRGTWTLTDVPNEPQVNEFEAKEARLYLLVEPVPGRVAVYVDERVAPGSATNLEAFARYRSASGQWFVQVGRMYLPFGLRIEDDSAFTRRIPGLNMTTPDDGVQVGLEVERWSAQLAVSNGSGGGPEVDSDKQVTGQATYVDARFRTGLGASINSSDSGDRSAYSAFAGVRTGPIAWLGELALVEDESFPEGTRRQATGLVEANWLVAQGHNLKLTAEWFDPDRDVDEDDQARWSLVYEIAPIQFVQLRLGARLNDGIPQNDLQNLSTYFIELHGFF